jgi:O-antigen/teichoic acid export membrane protein
MNLIHRSILFSALERYGSLFFFVISTAFLSRLLTPAEFGLYAFVNALVAVTAASFQEFGGANYLIQKQTLSEQNIRTAFTVTMLLSAVFAGVFFELRGLAAWYFSEDDLKSALAVASINFLLSPFSMTISALLRRDMTFEMLARCNLAGGFVTAASSVALAALDYGFMAPILGTIAGNATGLVLLMISRPNFRCFRPSLVGYRDVMHFGAYSSGVALINVFYNLAPQLILGRILDFTAVGLYNRAINVTQLFDKFILQVLSPVIMPAIFAHTRGGADLRRIYLDAIELLAVLQWPFLITFALLAEPIIWIWFGPAWSEIVTLIQMLCFASLSLFAACLTYPVLVAVGRVRDTLVSSLISLPPSLALIFVASFFGVQAVAASALLTLPLQAIVAFYFIASSLAIRPADLFRRLAKSAIVSAFSIAGTLIGLKIAELSFAGPLPKLMAGGILAAAGWCFGLVVTKHPLLTRVLLVVNGISFPLLRLPFLNKSPS